MAQFDPEPLYDHPLAERVTTYLHTRDPRLFPFTANFNEAQRRSFMNDLREGLADLIDSGSARKTSATGFMMSDRRLHEIVAEWRDAAGGWPRGADPTVPDTALGPFEEDDEPESVETTTGERLRG